MKNIVRCFAIALAVTGFVATTANGSAVKASTKLSAHPIPSCAPNTGDCGFGNW